MLLVVRMCLWKFMNTLHIFSVLEGTSSLIHDQAQSVLPLIWWNTVVPEENPHPYAATICLFQVENITLWRPMRPDVTLCRNITKLYFQHSSFCVIVRHFEDWYSTYWGISRHVRKRGGFFHWNNCMYIVQNVHGVFFL